jgi:hypothetical protein
MWAGRRRLHLVGLALLVLLTVVTALSAGPAPDRARQELAAWIGRAGSRCSRVTDQPVSPAATPGVPTSFAAGAVERTTIVCQPDGPSTVYLRFAGRSTLLAVLARHPDVRRLRVCVFGAQLFIGNQMTAAAGAPAGIFGDACRGLGGRIIPT